MIDNVIDMLMSWIIISIFLYVSVDVLWNRLYELFNVWGKQIMRNKLNQLLAFQKHWEAT